MHAKVCIFDYLACKHHQYYSCIYTNSIFAVRNTTTCVVNEPMMVSPFTLSTSYTFMGSCERVLLQSCDSSIDFMVRVDFITDSMENGAVGVFLVSGRSLIKLSPVTLNIKFSIKFVNCLKPTLFRYLVIMYI